MLTVPRDVEIGAGGSMFGSRRHVADCARWTSSEWVEHFAWRARTRPVLPLDRVRGLSDTERRAVLPSVAVFQRGESGQGRHLLKCARQHVAHCGDHDYVPALQGFVDEENDHGRMLGEYLDLHGFPRLADEWSNNGFRWLRHRAGLELTISVLVAAEVIAMVYYAALRQATLCPVLRELCEQILDDEVFHLHFQGQRMGWLRRGRSRWSCRMTRHFQTRLLDGMAAVVWTMHRPVFRLARLNLRSFFHRVHRHSAILQRIADANT